MTPEWAAMSKLFDARRWELLAEEASTIAAEMRSPEARRMMSRMQPRADGVDAHDRA
jgi:hypothetical protein